MRDVGPWITVRGEKLTAWYREHRQRAHVKVIGGIHRYLRDTRIATGTRVWGGFLGYELDIAGDRLIVQFDPRVLEPEAFRRAVREIARKANEQAYVTGPQLGVTVQRGCFSAAQVSQLRRILHEDGRFSRAHDGGVALDGRYHAEFCGRADLAYAIRLQRRLGPVLALGHMCVLA